MCEVAAAACRHAGLDPFDLPFRNTGVYIGHAQGSSLSRRLYLCHVRRGGGPVPLEVDEFQSSAAGAAKSGRSDRIDRRGSRAGFPAASPDSPDVAASMVAGTISKAFGLTGPFLASIRPAPRRSRRCWWRPGPCSWAGWTWRSSAALPTARAIRWCLFSNAQAVSATGSRPFDADADGLVCCEGYVAVVMKTLRPGIGRRRPICAVVRGLGISSDGRGKSLWAPRKEGQIMAMRRAYRGGVEMAEVAVPRGPRHRHASRRRHRIDRLERSAARSICPPGKKIPITSVKANIGHTLEAAGLAGVIKTVLCMQHGTIPPAINVRNLNPKIDWDKRAGLRAAWRPSRGPRPPTAVPAAPG